jgi:D-glycero-alpha-D-manno-heptose 1-phosphate guanylyltransferase
VGLQDCDAIILCGGLGTRFREVIEDRPKGLAPVAGKPILELLVDDLVSQGIKRIILCVGHLRGHIIDYFKDRSDVEILFSIEETPLGTGGALKNARGLILSDQFLVLNGDSLCETNYESMFNYHKEKGSFITIVVSPAEESIDYGNIVLGGQGQILSFQEKVATQKHALISAGIYLINTKVLNEMNGSYPISLEHDFFPILIKKACCFGFQISSKVMDIGTPERYKKISAKLGKKSSKSVFSGKDQ